MIRRRIGYAVWLLLAVCLYFFENNTGTRVVLFCSALLPFIPPLRSAFFPPQEAEVKKAPVRLTVRTFARQDPEDPDDIRPYVPGDPIRRIHWKLSAKKDELLVRSISARQSLPEEETQEMLPESRTKNRKPAVRPAALLAGIILCGALLLLVPEARGGLEALCNRLFAASEAANAYAYRYFTVPENQSVLPAACLLLCLAVLLLTLAAVARSCLPAFGIMAACILFQCYFGLSFPAWISIPFAGLFAVRMMKRPLRRGSLAALCAFILLSSLLVCLLLPGVDAVTEDASEKARDALARIAAQVAGTLREAPEGSMETRRVHTRSMETGEQDAETEQEFRLETAEEEQIARPRWINWIKVILLLVLTVAVVTLPFTPFLLLNARKKKAREVREAFGSPDVREAVQAVFRQVIRWLEATRHGAGNLLYRDWAEHLPDFLPENYADCFARCAADYEESVYSSHVMAEEQRRNALALLEATETALWKAADRKQRIYLKVWMGLYE